MPCFVCIGMNKQDSWGLKADKYTLDDDSGLLRIEYQGAKFVIRDWIYIKEW